MNRRRLTPFFGRRIAQRNPVLTAVVVLVLLWFFMRLLTRPNGVIVTQPPADTLPGVVEVTPSTLPAPTLTEAPATTAPPTTNPFAVKRKVRHSPRTPPLVTVVIACRSPEEDPSRLVEALVAGESKYDVEFIVPHDMSFPDELKSKITAAAGSRPVLFIIVMTKLSAHPSDFDMNNRAALASNPEADYLLFLAPHLQPITPRFVDQLIAGFETAPRVGIVGCTTFARVAGESVDLTVEQQGFEVRPGNEREIAFVKRYNGFSARDDRVPKCDVVHAPSSVCFAVHRDDFFDAQGLGQFVTLTDLAFRSLLNAQSKSKMTRQVGALVGAIESQLGHVDISDRRLITSSFKAIIRSAYDRVVTASADADRLGISIVRSKLLPQDEAEFDIPNGDMLLRLPALVQATTNVFRQFSDLKANREPSREEPVLDLAFKLHEMNLVAVACGTAVAVEDPATLARPVLAAIQMLRRPSFAPSLQFSMKWKLLMLALLPFRQRFEANPVRVVWDAFCCGCCGFSNEIVHFVTPLENLYEIDLMPEPSCFCNGFPAVINDAVKRMHTTFDRYIVERASEDEIVIWVAHTDPMSFRSPVFSRRKPDYVVGRSMYEFTRIDENWVVAAKTDCDEIWVPAEWVKQMFTASGVDPAKLVVVPEAVDVHFFNPAAQTKVSLQFDTTVGPERSWRHWCNKPATDSAYTFYTNFKWEPRKGWDTLFEAYYRSFKGQTDVRLIVHTHIWFSGGPETYGDKHNTTFLRDVVSLWAKEKLQIGLDDFPPFCFLTQDLTEVAVAQIYNSVNAFVLPTRGEGWGLPTIQAMAMGLPTISTDWGGQMEFLLPDVSFPIPLDSVEELDADSVYRWRRGKKWGIPSINATAKLMRAVFDNPAKAAKVGARAREFIIQRFSEEAVTKKVDARLKEIRDIVIKRRLKADFVG